MPPGTPIAGYRALFAKDPVTGEVFAVAAAAPPVAPPPVALDNLSDVDVTAIAPLDHEALVWSAAQTRWVPGPSIGSNEVYVGPDDPFAADPAATVEMWYDTATPPPPGLSAAIDWWDPVVNYVEADRVLWPEGDPNVWSALEDTTGWEPGVAQPAPAYYTFPGGTTGPMGLVASAAPQVWANGVELRVTTNGTLGTTGTLAALGDADDLTLSMSGAGELTAFVKAGAGADLILTGTPYDPTIDVYIRVLVNFVTLTASLETSDGLDGGWITLDSVTYLAGTDPTVANAVAVHIGHDSTDTNNYDGTLGNVQTFQPITDTLLTSWEPFWQGTDGTGASPATGEDYTLLAGTVLTPLDVTDRPSPWYFLADYNGPYLPLEGGTITGDLYIEGNLSAADVVDRSALATKSEVMDLDLGAAGRLLDAIHPITFRRTDSSMRRVGLVVEDFEGSGEQDLTDRLIRSIDTKNGEPYDTGERGWSVAGMVAVLVAEVKRLRAEVDALRNGA